MKKPDRLPAISGRFRGPWCAECNAYEKRGKSNRRFQPPPKRVSIAALIAQYGRVGMLR